MPIRARCGSLSAEPQVMTHIDESPPAAPRIPNVLRHSLSLAETLPRSVELSQGLKRIPQIKSQIDGLLAPRLGFGQMGDGLERLLEAGHRLAVRAARRGLTARNDEIRERLVPYFP